MARVHAPIASMFDYADARSAVAAGLRAIAFGDEDPRAIAERISAPALACADFRTRARCHRSNKRHLRAN